MPITASIPSHGANGTGDDEILTVSYALILAISGIAGLIAIAVSIVALIISILISLALSIYLKDESGCLWTFNRYSIVGSQSAPQLWIDTKLGQCAYIRTGYHVIFAYQTITPRPCSGLPTPTVSTADPGFYHD